MQASFLSVLDSVRVRLRLASAGRRAAWLLWIGCALHLAALLGTRLTGWHARAIEPWTVAIPAGLALLGGAVFHRRASRSDAARRADAAAGTKDLFLSAALADASGGGYAPLVEDAARRKAAEMRPAAVVPFAPGRNLALAAAALAVLAAASAWLPALDPFGRAKKEDALAALRADLAAQKKALDLRLNNPANPDETLAAEVKRSLDKLKQTFDSLQPLATNENRQALAQSQKDLGEMWKKLADDRLREALDAASAKQSFGADSEKMRAWKEQLAQGQTSGLQQELREMAKLAEELAKTPDAERQAKLSEEMKQRLREMQAFAKENLSSQPLSQQMGQCQNQLQASQIQALSDQALQNLSQQLEISAQDLQSLAEQLQNLQSLEDALKAIQQAQQCNQGGQCDGSKTAAFKDLAQYAKWYQQMLASQGDEERLPGVGQGMKGPGTGKGGEAQDDPEQATQFDPQRNPGQLSAGKILMEWKTKEMAPTGAAREEYAKQVRSLKQNLSEALIEEQIPPGYHEAIQAYFDRMPEQPATEKGPANP